MTPASTRLYLGMRALPVRASTYAAAAGAAAAHRPPETPHNARMRSGSSTNACGRCGATSYRDVIERDAMGAMRRTGRYRCTRCRLEFSDIDDWRSGQGLPAGIGPARGAPGSEAAHG